MIFTYTLNGWKAAGITEAEDLTERAHFKPGPIHTPVCMATLYFLLEIKNKFLLLDAVLFQRNKCKRTKHIFSNIHVNFITRKFFTRC